jgi:hypothetical protein
MIRTRRPGRLDGITCSSCTTGGAVVVVALELERSCLEFRLCKRCLADLKVMLANAL